MSTNRVTWLRASRWNDERCNRVLDRVERPLTAAGVFVLAAIVLVALALHPRREAARALQPMMAQARAKAATYESAKPGDYVYWCIDNPGKALGMLDGNGSQPLVLEGGFPVMSGQNGGRCVHSLAKVLSREPQGLKLQFVGQP